MNKEEIKEECQLCKHEKCGLCKECHNIDCNLFMKPFQDCFNQLIPK